MARLPLSPAYEGSHSIATQSSTSDVIFCSRDALRKVNIRAIQSGSSSSHLTSLETLKHLIIL